MNLLYIYPPLDSFPIQVNIEFWVEFPVLCSRSLLVICFIYSNSVQFSSVAQSCPTPYYPMNHSTPGLSVHHQLPEFTQTHVHWGGDAIQPSHPLHPPLLPPSTFPSTTADVVLLIRWPKYWSFTFSINPSNEYWGLSSFRIDWFDLFAVQGNLKCLL